MAEMNQEELWLALEHLYELKCGMTSNDVKMYGLRPFCKRVQRKRDGKLCSLYTLEAKWMRYVQELSDKIKPTIIQPEDQVIVSDESSTIFITPPTSSSSFIMDGVDDSSHIRGKLASEVYESVLHGECHLNSIFDRVMLLKCYFSRLCKDGLTSTEIIQHDLYGMLNNYLIRTEKGLHRLKDNVHIHIEYLIYKYYQRDIGDYLRFVKYVYNSSKHTYLTFELPSIDKTAFIAVVKLFEKMEVISNKTKVFINSPSEEKALSKEEIKKNIDILNKECHINFFAMKSSIDFRMNNNDLEKILSNLKPLIEVINIELKLNFDLNEEWRKSQMEAQDTLIFDLIDESFRRVDIFSKSLGHPLSININILTCLYYILNQFNQEKRLDDLTNEILFERLTTLNLDEISRIISAYLRRQVKNQTK